MKSKTIRLVLRKKIDAWLASITDPAVKSLLEKNVIVTGGAIASMLLKEKVNDFDVYFRTRAAAVAAAEYYVKNFTPPKSNVKKIKMYVDKSQDDRVKIMIKSAGVASDQEDAPTYEYFENRQGEQELDAAGYVGEVMQDPGGIEDAYEETQDAALENEATDYKAIFLSTNAITLSGRVQLVLRFYGEPEEIHANYDFIHCTNYWKSWDGELVLSQPALESLLARELRYVGSKYPVCSLIRLRKFIKRNWTINAGQILKMVMQVNELDLKDIKVLEDQLTGVDVAYFCELVEKLKASDPEKVNSAYLVEIIDRMF